MKRRDGIYLWATLIAVFALARVATGHEEKQQDKSTGTRQDTTIYAVPKYGGDFWSRSYLTGDWGGLRSNLAEHGVQFEFNVTQIFQDVASRGTKQTGRYSGLTDMVLKLDSQKLGLWPGGEAVDRVRRGRN